MREKMCNERLEDETDGKVYIHLSTSRAPAQENTRTKIIILINDYKYEKKQQPSAAFQSCLINIRLRKHYDSVDVLNGFHLSTSRTYVPVRICGLFKLMISSFYHNKIIINDKL
jgi:hypothetical protein